MPRKTQAGYSGTPLARKLGIKEGHRVLVLGAEAGFVESLQPLPDDVTVAVRRQGKADVILMFCADARGLQALEACRANMRPATGLWVAWPKKSSGRATDLSFDVVQGAGLGLGLVDNKVCAVDETWSGLRFVIRTEDR